MDQAPREEVVHDAPHPGDHPQEMGRLEHGCAMGCLAVVFAAPAAWIFWLVRKFADGDGWFEFTVRLVLDELIISVGFFAVVVLIWGVFAPQRLAPIVDWAARHTAQVVFLVAALLFGSLILFIFVFAILSSLGINF